MIIIIVGPDGSGKSTLAKQISEQTGYAIEHRSKPKNQAEKDVMMNMYRDVAVSSDNIILDRAWYCEMVYGDIMRDASCISMDQMYELEELIANNKGGLIIHCTDDTGKLWDRCMDRGEDYIQDISTLSLIKNMYDWLMHYIPHKIPVVRYEINENMS